MRAIRRSLVWAVVTACVVLLATAGPSQAQVDILSGQPLSGLQDGVPLGIGGPESVVSVSAKFAAGRDGRPGTLSVTARIAPPWYTYSTTQKPILATPTTITVDSSTDYRLAGDFRANLPPKIVSKEGHVFETYESEVTWQAPLEIRPGVDPRGLKVAGKARIQVCNDQSCLNPTSFAFAADYAGAKEPATGATATGFYANPAIHAVIRGELEPKAVVPGSTVNLILTAEPTAGWHIYEWAPKDTGAVGFKPTVIALTNSSGFRSGPPKASAAATEERSDVPGVPTQRYHDKNITWTTPIAIPKDTRPGEYPIEGLIGYQTCMSDSRCDMPRAARFAGTIVVGAATAAGSSPLAFGDAKYMEAAKAADAQSSSGDREPIVADNQLSSLPVVIVFGLVGGFLLNLMPCVLPVIGLKILSFAEQAGRSRAQILALNIWYSLGMLAVFLVLAALASGVSLGLREQNLGWGEQFSSTSFNVTMVAIVFVMALSFLGVWEIPIPGFVGSGSATELASRGGAFGAFAKGVLTTVLATPCSGPMIGPVLGYTLNATPAVTFAIFTSIGLGMASPYLAIGAFPALIRFLPKPGAWMDTFKQIMGFCMLATIVFFFSFMKKDYLVPTFALMVGLWAGCWWIGRTSLVEPLGRKMKAWTQGAAFAALVGWAAFAWLAPHESLIRWQNFSSTQLSKLTHEGKTVMVDFTADWCANCKFNLFTAIETDAVKRKLEANQVVPLLADYTDGSPDIKSTLASLNSSSIPVLAVFPADGRPIVLDGIVTKQQVLDALDRAGPSKNGGKSLATASP